ncbi:MAG: SdrD B-like domain-containing protein [Actinomycetaceae bacterium]|nr:SdrD B-like domain-containing protein [Actinomycetaceae bacterium]
MVKHAKRAAEPAKARLKRIKQGAAVLVSAMVLALIAPFVGVTPATAAINPQIVVSDISLVKVENASGGQQYPGRQIYRWDFAKLSFKWNATQANPALKNGDSFTVELPSALHLVESTRPVNITMGSDPTVYGTCERAETLLTCTFNDKVDERVAAGFSAFQGDGEVIVQAFEVTDANTVPIKINNADTKTIDLPGNTPIQDRPQVYEPTAALDKSSYSINGKSTEILWQIKIGTQRLAEAYQNAGVQKPFDGNTVHTFELTDMLGPGQIFSSLADFKLQRWQGVGDTSQADIGQNQGVVATGDGQGDRFKVTVNLEQPTVNGTKANIRITGPFEPNTNYILHYKSKPADGAGTPGMVKPGFEYTNRIAGTLEGVQLDNEHTISYTDASIVTIQMEQGFGSFAVAKTVAGPKAFEIPADTKFPVNFTWTLPRGLTVDNYGNWQAPGQVNNTKTGGTASLEVTAGNTTAFRGTFPEGTVITLSEDLSKVNAPADTAWNTPVFMVGGQQTNTFTVENQKVTIATLSNSLKTAERPRVSVGDYVWKDVNRDGLQDKTDVPLQGVELTISRTDDQPVLKYDGTPYTVTTTTSDTGAYLFKDLQVLPQGIKYKVTVTNGVPAGLLPTTAGANNGAADNDSSTGFAIARELPANGDSDMTLDFGYVEPQKVSVGDKVWEDTNKDGRQDNGEPGIDGVTLTISRTDGQPVKKFDGTDYTTTTKTENGGVYNFTDLQALPTGTQYVVTVTNPAGYQPTKENQGDKAGDSSTGSATSTDLPNNGDNDPTLDFGFIRPKVSVGDYVWVDKNDNGLQDDGADSGIAGIALQITGPDGFTPRETTTGPDGKYLFSDLPALTAGQKYTVTIIDNADNRAKLAAYNPAKENQGNDRKLDSSTNTTDTIAELAIDGAEDLSLDFGFVKKPAVSVGDYVWHDVNRDGLQDATDVPLQDVVLTISRTDGQPVLKYDGTAYTTTTKTDKDGKYLFENLQVLPDGVMYKVEVTSGVPADLVPTTAGVGDDRGKDSSTASATAVALPKDGDKDLTLDFGFASPRVSVGDRVWFDENKNGLQDDGEPGIADVTLTVSRTDGKPVMKFDGTDYTTTTKTNQDGMYGFADLQVLPDGVMYVVTVTDPAGYQATVAETGDDRAKDSSAGKATAVALPKDGDKDLTLDFGYIKPAVSVGDYVWHDVNRDGLQDATDVPLQDVVLTISRTDGQPVLKYDGTAYTTTTKTDKDGKYLFENLQVLPDGVMYKVEVTSGVPADLVPTTAGVGDDRGKDSSTASATAVALPKDGDKDLTLDFGYINPQVSVGDKVWEDLNRNGIQDKGEPGIPGVTLTLHHADGTPVKGENGEPMKTVTDKDGIYNFTELPVPADGKYIVKVEAPKGYTPTTPGAGDDRAKDSSTGSAESTPLTKNGDHDPTLDFGFVKKVITPPNLPNTGANVAVFSALALALFGLGVVLVQRRKTN